MRARGPTRGSSRMLERVRGDQDAGDHRQEGQPAGHRAVALDLLEVVSEEQEDAEDRDPGQAHREVGAAPGPVQDHPQREQGVTDPALGEHERGQQDHPGGERADGQGGGPAGGLCVREPEDDSEQPGRGEHGSRPVHPRTAVRPVAPHVSQGAGHRDRGEEQVDVQGPAPGEVLGQDAAEDEPHGTAAARDGSEDAERPAALARIAEGTDQGAQGGGCENGAECALKRPGRHQHAERRGGAAERRGEREPDQAGDEDPLAAEHVAEPAADQQQAAERQGVRGYHPLPVAVREAQGVLSRRQGDVHHGGVQDHHELGDSHDDQDQPAMVAGRGTLVASGRCYG